MFGPDKSAIFPKGMDMVVQNLGTTVKNWVKTPKLVIVEFILDVLPKTGSAGQLLYLSLAPNYEQNPHDLHHEPILFNLKDDASFE